MRKWMVLIVVAAGTALGGCATTGDNSYASHSPRDEAFPVDAVYMQTVAAAARERGVDIRWINPPRQRAERDKTNR